MLIISFSIALPHTVVAFTTHINIGVSLAENIGFQYQPSLDVESYVIHAWSQHSKYVEAKDTTYLDFTSPYTHTFYNIHVL